MKSQVHLFMYYGNTKSDKNQSFKKATQHAYDRHHVMGSDKKKMISFITKKDFINAWNKISVDYPSRLYEIASITIFSHGSKSSKDKSGLEFPDGTLNREGISSLTILNWSVLGGLLCLNGVGQAQVLSEDGVLHKHFLIDRKLELLARPNTLISQAKKKIMLK